MKVSFKHNFLFLACICFLLSACKKAGTEAVEVIEKKILKKIAVESTELEVKKTLKYLTKKELKLTLIEKGIDKKVSNIAVKKLNSTEIDLFINDIKKLNPRFISEINKSPDLILSYKKLIKSESNRGNLNYLYQTKNWINNGEKGILTLKIPKNIGEKYLGKEFNNVPFVQKIINFDGINYKGVFPDFSKFKVFTNKIDNHFLKSSDKTQFEICRNALRESYEKNSKEVEKLLMSQNERFIKNGGVISNGKILTNPKEILEKQIKDIRQVTTGKEQGRIFGFVWHHNENTGVIDLIAYDKHNDVKHIGGRLIWGGGSAMR